jgi:hypothetical protein
MFTLFITLLAFLITTVQAATSDIAPHANITLPQCGTLFLTWKETVSPYKVVINDVTNGYK